MQGKINSRGADKFSRAPRSVLTPKYEADMSDQAIKELGSFLETKRLNVINRAQQEASRERSLTVEHRHMQVAIREVG